MPADLPFTTISTWETDVLPVLTEEGAWQIGIYFGTRTVRYGLAGTAKLTFEYIHMLMREMLTSLKNLIFKFEGADEVTGVVGIVAFMVQETNRNIDTFISMFILITMNLGIMNLLPIPALDGGRLLLLVIEAIRRKPLDRNKEAIAVLVTFVLLLGLMLVITVKDIAGLIR